MFGTTSSAFGTANRPNTSLFGGSGNTSLLSQTLNTTTTAAAATEAKDVEVDQPPEDSIQAMRFGAQNAQK